MIRNKKLNILLKKRFLHSIFLRYVFITKIETGGIFWKVVFNRLIFAIIFWQLTMVGVMNLKGAHIQSIVVVPLIFLTLILKFVCSNRFDKTTRYYTPDPEKAGKTKDDKGKHKEQHIHDEFRHPAYSKKLIIPMIHANVQDLLKYAYHGRITDATELSRDGKQKTIKSIEDGDNILKIQPVETHELYVFDEESDFNESYQSMSEKE
jgi:calcium permeable stress-gated cation channel